MRRLLLASLLAFVGHAAGCTELTHSIKIRGTNLGAAIDDVNRELTAEDEYYVGRMVGTYLLARVDYKYFDQRAIAAHRLEGLSAYVSEVGALLALAALQTERPRDRPAPLAGWHFVVVDSDELNAWSAPGGFIFITKQTVLTAQSEDELAAVLAHEIAHVVRGHALGSIKKARAAGLVKRLLTSKREAEWIGFRKLKGALDRFLDGLLDTLVVKGYSRATEYEADRVGAAIASAAGYDPTAATRFLMHLADQERANRKLGWFRTHPKAKKRIAKLAEPLIALGGSRPVAAARTARFKAAQALVQAPSITPPR